MSGHVMKKSYVAIGIVVGMLSASAFAGDVKPSGKFAAGQCDTTSPMPALGTGIYGTKYTDASHGNLGQYLYRGEGSGTSGRYQFTITLPSTVTSSQAGTLQMANYDVDTDASPPQEMDDVYVNGTKIGTLNGKDSTCFTNIFTIPIGVLKAGANTVEIDIDTLSGSWAVQIDWGVITLSGGGSSTTGLEITRGWVSPTITKAGNWINVFAEVSGGSNISKVEANYGGYYPLATMTDPTGKGTYSGQFEIPTSIPPGFYNAFQIIATDKSGNKAYWPGVTVK
jgi:hypothetical protein